MKKIILLSMLAGITLTACTKKTETTTEDVVVNKDTLTEHNHQDEHNAQNSLDWAGTYEATLPCADCPGIKTTVVLKSCLIF